MLQLNAEQVQRLQQIQLQRDTRALAGVLAAHFPDVPARVGDRYPALVALAVQRGAAHGLSHALCIARLLGCWFMLGAEFETRPGFEWARLLLSDPQRGEGAKVFQLCRRTREALAATGGGTPGHQAAAPLTADAFDRAIAGVDAALLDFGLLGALQRGGRVALGAACDIDAVELRPVASPGGALEYRVELGQWRRLPRAAAGAPVTVKAAAAEAATPPAGPTAGPKAALPPRLGLLSAFPGAAPAQLRLRTLAAACCDRQVHPLVTLNGPDGIREWRGGAAADIALGLYAQPPAEAADADALQPAIAVETAAQVSVLTLGSCGLRDGGPAVGELTTQIAVYPAQQHLCTWHRDARPPLAWPAPPGGGPAAPPSRCRIEREGVPLDASRWQAGLDRLDRQLDDALARLHAAWERASGVEQARLQAEPALLCGDAGLNWGWADGPHGLASPPFMRLAAQLDLVACRLDLRFSGRLALQGSQSVLALHSHGSALLQRSWQRSAADADLLPTPPLRIDFRQPFVFELQPLARAELAHVAASPASGAVVGSVGLRPRPDGAGLQWFAQLGIEAVQVLLHWHDPLLGQQTLPLPLLPALDLVDWSLG